MVGGVAAFGITMNTTIQYQHHFLKDPAKLSTGSDLIIGFIIFYQGGFPVHGLVQMFHNNVPNKTSFQATYKDWFPDKQYTIPELRKLWEELVHSPRAWRPVSVEDIPAKVYFQTGKKIGLLFDSLGGLQK